MVRANGATYLAASFHFHTPAEHTIGGVRYPLELHIVHQKIDSHSENANQDADDLLVIAIHFMPSNRGTLKEGSFLTDVVRSLPNRTEGDKIARGYFTLHTLLDTGTYMYRYAGSLTIPPCTESVSWVILHPALQVSAENVAKMISLLTPKGTLGNYRAPQNDKNKKMVYRAVCVKSSATYSGNSLSQIMVFLCLGMAIIGAANL
eukprot:GHVN01056705.1.p1 GENE.GHVN01056705.1~~GHVN01056705.1.p1  ORF type:complete len:205 (+),score=18.64 GHVN01056705.1:649-1263(+)